MLLKCDLFGLSVINNNVEDINNFWCAIEWLISVWITYMFEVAWTLEIYVNLIACSILVIYISNTIKKVGN